MLHHLPNAITLVRLALVPPVVLLILDGSGLVAFVLFALAGLSDGIDGFLARRFGWESSFGRIADPLADKGLMLATALALTATGQFPPALMGLMVVKDVSVLAGIGSYWLFAGFPRIRPRWFGKGTTFLQILLIASIMLDGVLGTSLILLAGLLAWLVAIATAIDGVGYLYVGTRELARDPRWRRPTEPRAAHGDS